MRCYDCDLNFCRKLWDPQSVFILYILGRISSDLYYICTKTRQIETKQQYIDAGQNKSDTIVTIIIRCDFNDFKEENPNEYQRQLYEFW